MKIFVNARFLTQSVSGVQRYAIECSRQIKKIYPNIIFIAPGNIINKDVATELDAQVIGKNTGHLWEQADLPRFMAKQKGAPLLNMANTAPLFYSHNYITIHDLAFYHYPGWNSKAFSAWYNILVPRIAHKAKHIYTVSKTMRDELVKYYKIAPATISVTYNGISQRMVETGRMTGDIKKEKIILSVGTFNTRKNHQNLIKAFLQSKIKDTHQLVLVGDKNKVFSESSLDEEMLQHSGIKIYARFTEEELIAMYRKAEAVVSLSMYEGFGIPLLEGLYNGCKLLCSDIPVYREVYTGYAAFCDPYSIDNISAALNQLPATDAPGNEVIDALLDKCNYANAAQVIVDKILSGR